MKIVTYAIYAIMATIGLIAAYFTTDPVFWMFVTHSNFGAW